MIIKQYDTYEFKLNDLSRLDIIPIIKSMENIYCVRMFLVHSVRNIPEFIQAIETYSKGGFLFELAEIHIDNQNNLVYITDGWYEYNDKLTTPEIERLYEEDNFIELCKIGVLNYIIMSKKNFMHLLLAWDKILNQVPCFAILYQDDKDWYDVLPFETQEAMEQFVADHTKKE